MPPTRTPQEPPQKESTPAVDEVLEGGPEYDEFDPEYVLNQALDAEDDAPEVESDPEPQPEFDEAEQYEKDLQGDEEVEQREDTKPETAKKTGDKEEVDGEAEADEDPDEELSITRGEYARLMDMLGLDDDGAPATPEPAPTEEPEAKEEAPATPKPQPISAENFKLPETDDELVDVLSSPEAYKTHISNVVENSVTTALAAIEPIIADRAMRAYYAMQFEMQVNEALPGVSHELQKRALMSAQRKLGSNASYDDLLKETIENCRFAARVAGQAKKAGERGKPKPGRFAPKTSRKTRPNAQQPKPNPTEEAFAEMVEQPGYSNADAAFLRDLGAV